MPCHARVRGRIAVAAVLVLVAPAISHAGLVDDESWRKTSDDGRYVLVMVSQHPVDEDFSRKNREAEVRDIRRRYQQSGLYRNDGSSEPLWTIPYHLPVYAVYLAPDGEYLVLAVEHWSHTISNIGPGGRVHFYRRGEALASYQEPDFIRCFAFKWLASRLLDDHVILCRRARFDPQALTYTVTTSQSEEVVFDVTTGKIVRRWSPWLLYEGILLVAVPLIVFGLSRRGAPRAAAPGEPRRSRLQFSLQETFGLVTAICLFLWLANLSGVLAIACFVIGFVGGALAWFRSRNRRAWPIGAMLSLYGGFLGVLAWARLSDYLLLLRPSSYLVLGTLVALGSVGILSGGWLGGWLERRRQHLRAARCTGESSRRIDCEAARSGRGEIS
jgi:hypothetical protein